MKILFNPVVKRTILPKVKKHTQKPLRLNSKLPIVATPLLLYNLKGERDAANTRNCLKAIEKQKKLLESKKITEKEFKKREKIIKEYYKKADKLPADEVSSEKIKRGEPTFTGHEDNNSISINDPEYVNSDIEDVDVSMPPELQEIYENSIDELPDGLLANLGEYASGMFEECDNIFSTLKGFLKDITDWLE